ncbi:MAG: alpha/beta fold hydrolase [Burkholderiales bacterium]
MSKSTTAHFKTSDDCNIAYTLHAAPRAGAPRVALVHSLALDRSIWDGVVQELAQDAEVLTFDCRGHGGSGRRPVTYTPALFARDLAELMDHLQWPTAVVAGCSMGGMVAQAFAANHPQRTAGLCLIDTTAWYGADAPKTWRERAATARAKGLGALIGFQETRWFSDAFRAAHPGTVQALKDVFLANDLACYEKTCEMLGDADLRPQLAAITAPGAIVVGDEDYATPLAMAEALHRALPQSTLTVIAGGRHITPAEKPREVAARIRSLLAGGRR